MEILVCIKRVPDVGSKIELTPDQRAIQTRHLGFTISPHEECGVEEAVRIIEEHGGRGTVLTLGPSDAEEQLRDSLARGMDRGILLETDGQEWDAEQTARAILEVIRKQEAQGVRFDLLLFGNESADAGNNQVGIRVAHALQLPCVTGVKKISVGQGGITARREGSTGWEIYEVVLPAVVTVKEGLNLPRHPSLRGTMTARKKPVERLPVQPGPAGLEMLQLRLPEDLSSQAEILGQGPLAVPRILEVLEKLEIL